MDSLSHPICTARHFTHSCRIFVPHTLLLFLLLFLILVPLRSVAFCYVISCLVTRLLLLPVSSSFSSSFSSSSFSICVLAYVCFLLFSSSPFPSFLFLFCPKSFIFFYFFLFLFFLVLFFCSFSSVCSSFGFYSSSSVFSRPPLLLSPLK